jgi:putative transposase
MANYRRYFVPGGTYFFTVVTYRRARFLCEPVAREILRIKLRDCKSRWPFDILAIVLLPDHLHSIWSLPPGDDAYSRRWGRIKQKFTSEWLARGGRQLRVTANQREQRRAGVWQHRFWEHTIVDENDFERHFDYIHYNPVKHGYVGSLEEWPYSSFHRWVKVGVYDEEWGRDRLTFDDLDQTAME